MQYTTAAKAGFITGLSVVVVPLVQAIQPRRLPTVGTTVGVLLATVGLGLISLGDDLVVQVGDLLVLGCAFGFGLHVLVVGHFATRHDVLALTTVQVVVVAVLNGTAATFFEQSSAPQPPRFSQPPSSPACSHRGGLLIPDHRSTIYQRHPHGAHLHH